MCAPSPLLSSVLVAKKKEAEVSDPYSFFFIYLFLKNTEPYKQHKRNVKSHSIMSTFFKEKFSPEGNINIAKLKQTCHL